MIFNLISAWSTSSNKLGCTGTTPCTVSVALTWTANSGTSHTRHPGLTPHTDHPWSPANPDCARTTPGLPSPSPSSHTRTTASWPDSSPVSSRTTPCGVRWSTCHVPQYSAPAGSPGVFCPYVYL